MFFAQVLVIEDDTIQVSFMKRCNTTSRLYQWPNCPDIGYQPQEDVLCAVASPNAIKRRGQLVFSDDCMSKVDNIVGGASHVFK